MAPTGMESFQLGNTKRDELRSDWEVVKVEMMYQSNLAKFSQNDHLRSLLVNSRGPIDAQGGFWKTWNEVLLERIREELRDPDERDHNVLRQRIASMAAYRAAAKDKDEHAIQVATRYAAKRMPIPTISDNAVKAVVVVGVSKELDGSYQLDFLEPEANGQAHYCRRQGGHLYFGVKHGKSAWVLDEDYCPREATGHAFVSAASDGSLPPGQQYWQCFDGSRHVERIVTIEVER